MTTTTDTTAPLDRDVDVLIVGAGLAGIYAIHKLRDQLKLEVQAIEAFSDVGGVWFTNRYPGARVDSLSQVFCYTFNDELIDNWSYSEKYPTQPEILKYINFAAGQLDIRRSVKFNTRVNGLTWNEAAKHWEACTDRGDRIRARFVVSAAGGLSAANKPDFKGYDDYQGQVLFTAHWPHDPVDLAGKRIGVIGTGSSGIQVIPELAKVASELVVFQRTPHFATPAKNVQYTPEDIVRNLREARELNARMKHTYGGNPLTAIKGSTHDVSPEERRATYERLYEAGDFSFWLANYDDLLKDITANEIAAEFLRDKIRSRVKDPKVAEKLLPRTYPYGTKRQPLETNYYETFNLDHVRLIDINEDPILGMTATGIETETGLQELDVIVFATGFDALTGSLTRMNITGVGGVNLADKWKDGPSNYLGISTAGFPNLFALTGPGSPSVLANLPMAIEQHVEFTADMIDYAVRNGIAAFEAEPEAEAKWTKLLSDLANETLFPVAASWYMGANVPGKPRVFMPYIDGMVSYRARCDAVAANGYTGFKRR
ncbi:NAD(P)/FAD-dependent oxidoreductase [Gemmobacter sp.]|uniref:flavin-containing monooxygenase n=1 Tax=Gemmobacter sp. TaxID=1898957 RepID=UPI002AFDF531|nr:NAD(P)/FAD-dependent oxidoreductase [Gemmobacter sp.]